MKKKFVILLGGLAAALMITVVGLLFTGPKMRNQRSLVSYEAVLDLPPNDVVPFEGEKKTSLPANAIIINASSLARGKVYYNYYCVFCHGEDGKGNGPVGESYFPKPADLTKNVKQYDSVQLYNAAFTGIHSPVIESIVSTEHKRYILVYLKNGF